MDDMERRLQRELAKQDIAYKQKRISEIERQIRKLEHERTTLENEIEDLREGGA
ncbi:MAG TPA: hypothetical protein VFJ18_12125 [Pararhizobium sp.]|nr:hypothetical protein [Pararhizobium sp.]